MIDPERPFFTPNNSEFQPKIGYKTVEKSPRNVVKQTYALLELYYYGIIGNYELARDYLHDFTLGYLKAAEEGSCVLYDQIKGYSVHETDLETREAAGYAFAVFANLPDMAKSPYLANGFSREGMLRAPVTQREFLARIKEIKIGIWQVVEGDIKPHTTLEAHPPVLRMFNFFEVGNRLPLRSAGDERKKINDLLDGIDISL